MDRDGIDLSPLDPAIEAERWANLLHRVNAAAAPELARRASSPGSMLILAQWTRPILAVAAVLALVSLSIFRLTLPASDVAGVASFAEALGFPTPVAEWLTEGRAPVEDDLLLALERGVR
jgi:hypothetical protein